MICAPVTIDTTHTHTLSLSALQAGYTPLHQAAQQGHVMVVNQLLKYEANPNVITTVRTSPPR